MKSYLTTVLGLATVVLVVALFTIKRGDNERHAQDVSATAEYSNRWTLADSQIAGMKVGMVSVSNSLEEFRANSVSLSNQLVQAAELEKGHQENITRLNQQLGDAAAENKTLDERIRSLTSQLADLSGKISVAQSSLSETNAALTQAWKEYGLLEAKLRQDVAERLIMERKFSSPTALQAQLNMLRENPVWELSADSIYAGLNIEVRSNGTLHVLSAD